MDLIDIERRLSYLSDRREIEDVIATYARGVDRLDRDALLSVFHEDARDDHGCFVGSREEFIDYVIQMHSTHHHATTHFSGSITSEIDGNMAHVETYYFFAAINKVGPPFTFVGGRYLDRMEKRHGRWAIVERKCLTDWAAPSINNREIFKTPEGKANFLHMASHEKEATRNGAWPSRDHNDPRYQRPLAIDPSRFEEWRMLMEKHGVCPAKPEQPNDGSV